MNWGVQTLSDSGSLQADLGELPAAGEAFGVRSCWCPPPPSPVYCESRGCNCAGGCRWEWLPLHALPFQQRHLGSLEAVLDCIVFFKCPLNLMGPFLHSLCPTVEHGESQTSLVFSA